MNVKWVTVTAQHPDDSGKLRVGRVVKYDAALPAGWALDQDYHGNPGYMCIVDSIHKDHCSLCGRQLGEAEIEAQSELGHRYTNCCNQRSCSMAPCRAALDEIPDWAW